jgi:hypothetical protein
VSTWSPLGALRRTGLVSCGVAVALCGLPALAGAATTPSSFTTCGGHVSADPGAVAASEPNLLDYTFSCDTSISAYTIIVNQQGDGANGGAIDDYNPSPSVLESDGVTPSPTEGITCEGTSPSDGINCNMGTAGAQLTNEYLAEGSVDPDQAYCKHFPTTANGKPTTKPGTAAVPQAVVELVVTDFTGAEDGPFILGPAKACPKVANVVPTPKPKTKPKTKTKTKTKTKSTSKSRKANATKTTGKTHA